MLSGAESNRTFTGLNSQAAVSFYRTFLNWGFHRLITWPKFMQWLIGAVRSPSLIQRVSPLKFEALHQTRRCTNVLTEQSCIPFIKVAILQSFILINSWTNLLINKQIKYPSGSQQSASTENLIQTLRLNCKTLRTNQYENVRNHDMQSLLQATN